MTTSFSFSLASKENETKEKALFPEVFFSEAENQPCMAKIFPRLQDFLTQNKAYTAEKDFKELLWNVNPLVF